MVRLSDKTVIRVSFGFVILRAASMALSKAIVSCRAKVANKNLRAASMALSKAIVSCRAKVAYKN
jgi:hypothetical protein